MSDEFEALLRSGMAQRVDAAPVFDDPGLADAAIAGAGRIRRRRRVAAATSGASLLVLGAAAFVWHPWSAQVNERDDVIAADTSTAEAQREFDMEFVVEVDGMYEVHNLHDDTVTLGDVEPTGVYRLATSYLAESEAMVWTTGLEGEVGASFEKPSPDETYVRVNEAGEQFAMVTPTADFAEEEYSLLDVAAVNEATAGGGGEVEPVTFTTSYDLSLLDWTAATAVFSADLHPTTGGDPGSNYMFNEVFDWGLNSVAAAGFESAVITDVSDPSYLCVADLEAGGGVATPRETCGPAGSAEVKEYLAVASGGASDPVAISEKELASQEEVVFPPEGADLGEYETRFMNGERWWSDPLNRWQMTGNVGDRTWLLLETLDDEMALTELSPPAGAIMPVLSYT